MSTTSTRIGRGRALARATDGHGSHEAADRLKNSGEHLAQKMQVLHAVRRFPFRTSKELAKEARLDRHMVARRLPDLKAEGLALERTDRKQKTWSLTRTGLDLARKEGMRA